MVKVLALLLATTPITPTDPVVSPTSSDSDSGQKVARESKKNLYSLLRLDQGSLRLFCSGFAYNSYYLATAGHCSERAQEILNEKGAVLAVGTNLQWFKIVSTWTHPQYDIGLVKVNRELPSFVKLSSRVRVGEAVFAYGFPGCCTRPEMPVPTFVSGVVSRLLGRNFGLVGAKTTIQHTAYLSGGMSGSPLFNADGEVIGVCIGSFIERSPPRMPSPAFHIATRIGLLKAARLE